MQQELKLKLRTFRKAAVILRRKPDWSHKSKSNIRKCYHNEKET